MEGMETGSGDGGKDNNNIPLGILQPQSRSARRLVALFAAAFSCDPVGPVTADSAPISTAICREVAHRPESPHSISLSTIQISLSTAPLDLFIPIIKIYF